MNSKPFSSRIIYSILAVLLLVILFLVLSGPIVFNLFSSINSSLSINPTAPPPVNTEAADEPTPLPVGTATHDSSEQPAIPETRRLTLEYPPRLKAGAESDVMVLTLEVDSLGNITPTAQFAGNVTEGEVIKVPNLYETHNITAEAQFDIAGLEVKPSGSTFQPLKQGETVIFYWSVRAQDVGKYRGTVWLHLNFEDRSTGEKNRMPVSAQIVEIEAVDFFGFSTNIVRTSGLVGSVLGIIVGFPFFDDIVKYLWGKLAKRRKKSGKSTRKT